MQFARTEATSIELYHKSWMPFLFICTWTPANLAFAADCRQANDCQTWHIAACKYHCSGVASTHVHARSPPKMGRGRISTKLRSATAKFGNTLMQQLDVRACEYILWAFAKKIFYTNQVTFRWGKEIKERRGWACKNWCSPPMWGTGIRNDALRWSDLL